MFGGQLLPLLSVLLVTQVAEVNDKILCSLYQIQAVTNTALSEWKLWYLQVGEHLKVLPC